MFYYRIMLLLVCVAVKMILILSVKDYLSKAKTFIYHFIVCSSWLTSAGPDVTEAVFPVPPEDVFTPRAVCSGAEEGSDSLLLTHSTRSRTVAPLSPLCPRTIPLLAVGSYTHLAPI